MTPEMGLISSAILHRASHFLPQIAKIPRGFSAMLPCSLLGVHRKPRRRPGASHGQWSGVPGCGEAGGENVPGRVLQF